jgi:hypothetical protein
VRCSPPERFLLRAVVLKKGVIDGFRRPRADSGARTPVT